MMKIQGNEDKKKEFEDMEKEVKGQIEPIKKIVTTTKRTATQSTED